LARRRRGGLSAEDAALWREVVRSVTPLSAESADQPHPDPPQRQAPTQQSRPSVDAPPTPPGTAKGFAPSPFRLGQHATPPSQRHDLSPDPAHGLSTAPARIDGRKHRDMRRGRIRPEARIDLHGMTLAQAHPSLRRFITDAHAAGRRVVLVITGKGRAPAEGTITARPGVLRHQVPHWLSTPPLSALVLQVSPAHFRHGGDGAYYVFLRRRS